MSSKKKNEKKKIDSYVQIEKKEIDSHVQIYSDFEKERKVHRGSAIRFGRALPGFSVKPGCVALSRCTDANEKMKKRHRFLILRSIVGVPFDSVGRFRASLLLRTTCMPSIGKRWVLKGGFPYMVLNAEIMVEGW